MVICLGNMTWLFAVEICRSYLPWFFGVGVCYLPWEFDVAICPNWVRVQLQSFLFIAVAVMGQRTHPSRHTHYTEHLRNRTF